MRSDFVPGFPPEQSAATRVIDVERQQQIVFDGLAFDTVGFWNFGRFRARRSWFRRPGQIGNTVEQHLAFIRFVLPVMMSIIVVLPAPFAAMMARISRGGRAFSDMIVDGMKAVVETCTPSR